MVHEGKAIKNILKGTGIELGVIASMLKLTRQGLNYHLRKAEVDDNFKVHLLKTMPSITDKLKEELLSISKKSESNSGGDLIRSLYLPPGLIRTEGQGSNQNAGFIGDYEEMDDKDGYTIFREISPGIYKMKVKWVSEHAKAGFLRGFKDPTYEVELPYREITVNVYHKGRYFAFTIEGDSMDDGSKESLPNESVATGREIPIEHWAHNKLHSHKYKNWIFIHKTEGILAKRIASQDMEAGTIELLSLNPNKELYPNQTINIKDLYAVYNVVKREFND